MPRTTKNIEYNTIRQNLKLQYVIALALLSSLLFKILGRDSVCSELAQIHDRYTFLLFFIQNLVKMTTAVVTYKKRKIIIKIN